MMFQWHDLGCIAMYKRTDGRVMGQIVESTSLEPVIGKTHVTWRVWASNGNHLIVIHPGMHSKKLAMETVENAVNP